MKEIFEKLLANLKKQQPAVLVTVLSSSGSAPRGAGAHMLVGTTGTICGTVGGGRAEYESEKLAKAHLKQQTSGIKDFNLAPNDIEDLGMICGGRIKVIFTYFSPEVKMNQTVLQQLLQTMAAHQSGWLLFKLTAATVVLGFYSQASGFVGFEVAKEKLTAKPQTWQIEQQLFYSEPVSQNSKVYLFGGGHVSQALVPVLKPLNFYTVVYDDRAKFLTADYFPTADDLIVGDLTQLAQKITVTAADYAIVMTRGHQSDFDVERQLLKTPAFYIGVIGSHHKTAVHRRDLKVAGFSTSDIDRLNMPIGLKIGAETPAEIAISIAGQLIQRRAQK